jgi:hypothetical protein
MDIINAIRSVIFLVPGLAILLFPKKVYKFQVYLVKKLRIKYNVKRDRKYYPYIGIIFIIVAIILFTYSIIN